jgi:hypothetical protein
MKKSYLLLLFVIACIFASCDPSYQILYTVENNTNDSLLAKIPETYTKDTVKYLPPHQTVDIYSDGGLGYGSKISCCACGLATKSLMPKDTSRRNTKDIKAENNWILEHDGKDVVRCKLKVNQSDIH